MSLAQSFAQTVFARFINSPTGRVVRVVAGLALIGWGYTRRAETAGMILMVVGLIPLSAGSFNLCFISGMLGGPISGARLGGSRPPS